MQVMVCIVLEAEYSSSVHSQIMPHTFPERVHVMQVS